MRTVKAWEYNGGKWTEIKHPTGKDGYYLDWPENESLYSALTRNGYNNGVERPDIELKPGQYSMVGIIRAKDGGKKFPYICWLNSNVWCLLGKDHVKYPAGLSLHPIPPDIDCFEFVFIRDYPNLRRFVRDFGPSRRWSPSP
jgi:hypothetical protein